jgi:hypothetical protein
VLPAERDAAQSGSSAWTPRLWARPRALACFAGQRSRAVDDRRLQSRIRTYGRHIDPERGQDQRPQREGDLPALPGLIRRQPSPPVAVHPHRGGDALRVRDALRRRGDEACQRGPGPDCTQPTGGRARGTRPGLRDRHPLARARSHLITRRHVRAGVIATDALPIVDVVGERLVVPGRVLDLVPCTVDVHLLLG